MDREMRMHLQKFRLQSLAQKADEVMRRDAPDTDRCEVCSVGLGLLSNADLVVQSGNHKFCSEFCLEVFLDDPRKAHQQ